MWDIHREKLLILSEGGGKVGISTLDLRKQEAEAWTEIWPIHKNKIIKAFPREVRHAIEPMKMGGQIKIPGLGKRQCMFVKNKWLFSKGRWHTFAENKNERVVKQLTGLK